MSIYRQQASIGKKVEVFHQKSSAITSFSSPTAQSAAFNPKHLPSNSMAAKSLEVPGAQSKFISDTMRDLRKEELEVRATKRARTDQLSSADHSTLSKGHGHEKQDSQVACGIEILDEMELHPDTAQLVATSGGLITACKFKFYTHSLPGSFHSKLISTCFNLTLGNDTFLNVVKPTNSMTQIPLTIFDLVEPTSLHKLYGMLALALDEEVIVEQDVNPEDATSSSSYMSIIIPVKKFRHTNTKYEMTVSNLLHFEGRSNFDSKYLHSSFHFATRLYSWSISSPKSEIFSDGSNQLRMSQIHHPHQDLLVIHLMMNFHS